MELSNDKEKRLKSYYSPYFGLWEIFLSDSLGWLRNSTNLSIAIDRYSQNSVSIAELVLNR